MVDRRRLPVMCALLFVLCLVFTASPVAAEGPNLLQNPGLEAPFEASLPGKENCLIAVPWKAWLVEGTQEQTSQGFLLAPEFKMATWQDYPGNRVHSGSLSQQYFHSYGNFLAGVYQVVNGVTSGGRLRLSMWVMSWSCDNESKGNCGGVTSGDPSPMHLRIGIDPNGGTDPFAGEIVWSSEVNAYDAWQQISVEATAGASTVTVFVYSYPDYRSQDNNVYLDDAELYYVAPPATNTPVPTSTPEPTATKQYTDTPAPTDTPTGTNTPAATNTPKATLTTAASSTPKPTATLQASPTAAQTKVAQAATTAPTAAATIAPTSAPAPEPTSGVAEQTVFQKLAAMPGVLVLGAAAIIAIVVLVVAGRGGRRRRL